MLGRTSIADHFDAAFFSTDFWFMWCTTFAFQPWHSAVEFKRYLLRFTHMVSGFNTLTGIMRTIYNQYDSLVRPLEKMASAARCPIQIQHPRHRSRSPSRSGWLHRARHPLRAG